MTQLDNGSQEAAAATTKAGGPWANDVHPLKSRQKFGGCHQCGTIFGMQPVHRDTVDSMSVWQLSACAPWYKSPDTEYLYYFCDYCNPQGRIPVNFIPLTTITEVCNWIEAGPMVPDYDALAEYVSY